MAFKRLNVPLQCLETQGNSLVVVHGTQKVTLTANDCKPVNFIVQNLDDCKFIFTLFLGNVLF